MGIGGFGGLYKWIPSPILALFLAISCSLTVYPDLCLGIYSFQRLDWVLILCAFTDSARASDTTSFPNFQPSRMTNVTTMTIITTSSDMASLFFVPHTPVFNSVLA